MSTVYFKTNKITLAIQKFETMYIFVKTYCLILILLKTNKTTVLLGYWKQNVLCDKRSSVHSVNNNNLIWYIKTADQYHEYNFV